MICCDEILLVGRCPDTYHQSLDDCLCLSHSIFRSQQTVCLRYGWQPTECTAGVPFGFLLSVRQSLTGTAHTSDSHYSYPIPFLCARMCAVTIVSLLLISYVLVIVFCGFPVFIPRLY